MLLKKRYLFILKLIILNVLIIWLSSFFLKTSVESVKRAFSSKINAVLDKEIPKKRALKETYIFVKNEILRKKYNVQIILYLNKKTGSPIGSKNIDKKRLLKLNALTKRLYTDEKEAHSGFAKNIIWVKQKNGLFLIEDRTFVRTINKLVLRWGAILAGLLILFNLFYILLFLSMNRIRRRKNFPFDIFGLFSMLKELFDKIYLENNALKKKNKILETELDNYKVKEIRQRKELDIAAFSRNIEIKLQASEPTENLYAHLMEWFCENVGVIESALYLQTKDDIYSLNFVYNYYDFDVSYPPQLDITQEPFASYIDKGIFSFIYENKLYIFLTTNKDIIVGLISANDKFDNTQFSNEDILLANNYISKFITLIEKINSVTDPLTRLFNKRYFIQQLAKLFSTAAASKREESSFSLIMLDIDHFKKFNDTYGHQVGDFVLQKISEIIKNSLRDNDRAFRYGGEELTALLPATNIENAQIVAERIRKTIENAKFESSFSNKAFSVTVSLGVAAFTENMKNYEELIRNADIALYKAKEGAPDKGISGRNQVVLFTPELSKGTKIG